VRVPLTSVIMIFETTRDYAIIVPLMISNLVAYFVSSRLQREPIYEALLHQDGIHLPLGARAREALLMVGNAYRPMAEVFDAQVKMICEAAARIAGKQGAWPVVEEGYLRGMVTTKQIEEAMIANRGEEPLAAIVPEPGPIEQLTPTNFPHVHIDHTIDTALRRMAQAGLDALPVVSRTNVRDLKGVISFDDIMAAYRMGARGDGASAAD
jgi:chloride channel protein, CIC family